MTKWFKHSPNSRVWWKEPNEVGPFIFSFDRKKEYNFYGDFPDKLTRMK